MSVKKTITLEAKVKGAQGDIKKLKNEIEGLKKSQQGAKKGFGGLTGATKMLGTAFKALGIGLIIAAFMKIKEIFSGNIETARKFEVVMAKLSAAFDVVRDRVELFIKKLIELKNPFKAIKEAFSGTGDEIRKETKAIAEYTKQLQVVRDEERAMLLIRANANKIIAESRLLAEDETKSMQERLVALKEAVAEEQRVAQLELDTQEKKVKALQDIIDLGKSSEEDMIKLEQERARFIELQTASVLKQKRVVTEIVTFEKQIETQRKKDEANQTKRREAETRAKELGLEFDNKLTTAEINNLIKVEEKRIEMSKKKEETDKSTFEKGMEAIRKQDLSKEELEIKNAQDKYNKLIEIANQYGMDTVELTNRLNEELKVIGDKYDEEEEIKTQQKADKEFEMQNARIDQAQQIMGVISQIAQENLVSEKNELQKQLDAGIISQEEFDKASKKLEKEALKREKKNAVLQILIDTAQGVAGAIKAGAGLVFPANLGAIASGVIAVLSGIASAKAILNKVPGDGGGGNDSVDIGGGGSPAPQQAGNLSNLIPNVNSQNGQQPLQAYVVENDISNAQALQEELEIQATL